MKSLIEEIKAAHKDEPKRDLTPDKRTPEQIRMLLLLQTSLQSVQGELKDSLTQEQTSVLTKLSTALNEYINTKSDEEQAYRTFKDLVKISYLPELKTMAYKEKGDKQNSLIYILHSAVVAVFRAFFRIFDVLIAAAKTATGAKYQTKNDTPGYEPFFKFPEAEAPSSKRIAKLSKDFEKTIESFDKLKNIPERNANTWRNSAD